MLPLRSTANAMLLCVLGLGVAEAQDERAYLAQPKRTWSKRGVYFFDGPKKSPMAGLGKRSDFSSNRVALDDDHSTVSWDPSGRKLIISNDRSYEDETQIACVLLLGTGTTADKQTVPVGVHLLVYKEDDEFVTTIHSHVTVREGITQADFLSCQVVVDNGKKREVVLTKSKGLKSVREPFSDSALATIIGLQGVDHLEGETVDLSKAGARLADGSVGLGHGFLSKLVLRATMVSLEGSQPVDDSAPWASVFERGGYELRLTATSSLLPADPWRRNLFLLGLEDIPILQGLKENGLADGETLAFTFCEGEGTIRLGDKTWPVPDAAEAVRRYLEFDFIGGIVTHQMQTRLAKKTTK